MEYVHAARRQQSRQVIAGIVVRDPEVAEAPALDPLGQAVHEFPLHLEGQEVPVGVGGCPIQDELPVGAADLDLQRRRRHEALQALPVVSTGFEQAKGGRRLRGERVQPARPPLWVAADQPLALFIAIDGDFQTAGIGVERGGSDAVRWVRLGGHGARHAGAKTAILARNAVEVTTSSPGDFSVGRCPASGTPHCSPVPRVGHLQNRTDVFSCTIDPAAPAMTPVAFARWPASHCCYWQAAFLTRTRCPHRLIPCCPARSLSLPSPAPVVGGRSLPKGRLPR